MNAKFLTAVIVAAFISFFGGWAIWGMLLNGYFDSHTLEAVRGVMRDETEMVWWSMILANVLWGGLVVWVVDGMGSKTAASGAVTSVILMLLMSAAMNLFYYTMMPMYDGVAAYVVDILASAVLAAIIGAVSGWILGRGADAA